MRQRKPRDPQLTRKLETDRPTATPPWQDGSTLRFMGRRLSLVLNTGCQEATLTEDRLHLPLPPHASPQQIQDRAEAWLRDQAQRYLIPLIGSLSARANRRPPGLKLSFAAGSHWAQVDGDTLRCNWRLIEHPAQLIEQVVARAIDSLPPLDLERDLFGFAFSARHPGAT